MNDIAKKLILIVFALCLIILPVLAQPHSAIGGIQSQAELDPDAENFVPTSKAVADYVFNNIVLCSDYDNPDDAITAIGATETTLLVTETETCDTNFTVPATMTVKFERGGSFAISNGVTVTFNGQIDAGLWQIFAYTGTGILAGTPVVDMFYPQWWGATGDGVTDDYDEIVDSIAMINSAGGGILFFPKGTYVKATQGTLNLCTNLTILGTGWETKFEKIEFSVGNNDNIIIKDLWIHGAYSSIKIQSVTASDILIDNVKTSYATCRDIFIYNATVKNVRLLNGYSYYAGDGSDPDTPGICLEDSTGEIFIDNYVIEEAYESGIHIESMGKVNINNVTCINNGREASPLYGAGLLISGTSWVNFNNVITSGNLSGIWISTTSTDVIGSNFMSKENTTGVFIRYTSSDGNIILNNGVIKDNVERGINLYTSGDYAPHVLLSNIILGANHTGLEANADDGEIYASASTPEAFTGSNFVLMNSDIITNQYVYAIYGADFSCNLSNNNYYSIGRGWGSNICDFTGDTGGTLGKYLKAGQTIPTTPVEGDMYWDTTDHILKQYNGSAWISSLYNLSLITAGATNEVELTEFIRLRSAGTSTRINGLGLGANSDYIVIYSDISAVGAGKIIFNIGNKNIAELNATGDLSFEGATANDFETLFDITDPTADRTIVVPDSDQTIGIATAIEDNLILKADFADEDWGDVSVSSNVVSIDTGVIPEKALGLLSTTTVAFNADADTTLYTVPTGKRCVLSHAIIVAAADAGATTTVSIGANGTETDFIPANTLSNLDAQYDSVILQPIPNTTPLKIKSYAAATVIEAQVASQSGAAGNTIYLFGILY